ncbi:hypothetical protein VTK26DRAFT_135 [Humicola hyalothermophila]
MGTPRMGVVCHNFSRPPGSQPLNPSFLTLPSAFPLHFIPPGCLRPSKPAAFIRPNLPPPAPQNTRVPSQLAKSRQHLPARGLLHPQVALDPVPVQARARLTVPPADPVAVAVLGGLRPQYLVDRVRRRRGHRVDSRAHVLAEHHGVLPEEWGRQDGDGGGVREDRSNQCEEGQEEGEGWEVGVPPHGGLSFKDDLMVWNLTTNGRLTQSSDKLYYC